MATSNRARQSASVSFETPSTPPLAQAASLALGIVRSAKVANWVQVRDRLDEFDLNDHQRSLLALHDAVLHVVDPSPPVLTLAVCPECSGWTATSGQAPTRCKTTLGCAGKPVKAAAATKSKTTSSDPQLPLEGED